MKGVFRLLAVLAVSLAAAEAHAVSLKVCHGYSCYYRTTLRLGDGDLKRIDSLMQGGKASAEAERHAVSRVVQYVEKRAAAAVGVRDRAKSDFGRGRERGQMDCVDESTNTTALLKLLARRGLLRHHTVRRPVSRGFFIDRRYPHFTAVLREEGGRKWAVDSWYEPAGGPPDILPLKDWARRGVMGER